MKKTFFIFGYGVPKDVMKDPNYNRYLSFVFNKIYDLADVDSNIIFCGGRTDCFRPYRRTEAGEMRRFFKFLAGRKFIKDKTKAWKYGAIKNSLSTLENVLYASAFIKKYKLTKAEIYIFCEQTRANRVKALVKKVFSGTKVKIIAVDFDLSPNRYLGKQFIQKREGFDLEKELLALRNKRNLLEYRKWHQRKLKFFRENDVIKNPEIMKEWWNKNI